MSARAIPHEAESASLQVVGGRGRRRRLRGWVVFTVAVVLAFFLLILSRTRMGWR